MVKLLKQSAVFSYRDLASAVVCSSVGAAA